MFKLQRLEITGFKSFADYTEIVFTGDGITAVVGPNGCGKCVSGETPVTLADGNEIAIKELVETALRDSQQIEIVDDGEIARENPHGVEILSLNPQTLRLEPRPVSAFVKRAATPRLLRVRTRSGREIKATPYHPLFTLEKGELRAVRADEIKAGLRIAVPRRLPTRTNAIGFDFRRYLASFAARERIFVPFSDALRDWSNDGRKTFGTLRNWARQSDVPETALKGLRDGQAAGATDLLRLADSLQNFPPLEPEIKSRGRLRLPLRLTPDLARFLGLLIAEGRNTASNQIWLVNSNKAVNQEFARLAKELFNVEVCQRDYQKGATDNLIFSRALCLTFENFFQFPINSNSFEKQAPPQVFAADVESKWAFLSGLFEGDGYVCARRQKSNNKFLTYLEYVMASEKLARQVVSLLLQCGVFALLRPRRKFAANTADKARRTYFSVLIYGAKNLRRAAAGLSFVGAKRESLEKLRQLPAADNPDYDLIPDATRLVKEAARMAKVKIKPNRRRYPKLAAYCGQVSEASRNQLREVVEQIRQVGEVSDQAERILSRLETMAESDVRWDEVVSVEEIEPTEKWVYDLSVAETHNFVAGNIVVHNSNISDAIAWVLGEQSAKTLRGGEMQDVIFQGTRGRQPSGMAEVVLHLTRTDTFFEPAETDDLDEALSEFDEQASGFEDFSGIASEPLDGGAHSNGNGHSANGNHAANGNGFHQDGNGAAAAVAAVETSAPAKFQTKRRWKPRRVSLEFMPGETVSITRRLYRSGDSDYLLNGRQCRLRDIQDLFAGTGLAGASYALVQQERISQILSAKPSDRRALVEEAAGITKFRTRGRAAEIRLEAAKANLRRLADVVAEIERQANSLRRQAARTRRYKELQETFRALLRKVFVAEGRELSETLETLRAKLDAALAEEQTLSQAAAAKTEAVKQATQTAREAEDALSELRRTAAETALRLERLAGDRVRQSEQLKNSEERAARLAVETKISDERLNGLKLDLERLRHKNDDSQAANDAEQNQLEKAENEYQKGQSEVRRIESEIEKSRGELLQHTAAAERLREIAKQQQSALERLAERAEGLEREGERAEQTLGEKQIEIAASAEKIRAERALLSELQSEKRTAQHDVQTAREELQQREKAAGKIRDEANGVRHRRETLSKLDEQNALLAPAAQKLFAAGAKLGLKLNGTLADLLRVEARHEKAVEAALGSFLQTVLVETREDATTILEWLRDNDFGQLNVLFCQPRAVSRQPPDNFNRIGDLLGISGELQTLLQTVLPAQMNLRVIADLSEARSFAEEDCVTLGGESAFQNRLFSFGSRQTNQKSVGILSFKRELRELAEQSEQLKIELDRTEAEVKTARENLSAREKIIADLNARISGAERALMTAEMTAKSIEQERERAERHRKIVADEIRQLNAEQKEVEAKRIKARTDAETAEQARVAASAKLAEISATLTQMRERAESANAILSEKRAAAAAASERRRSLAGALRRIGNEHADLAGRIVKQRQELAESTALAGELRESLAENKKQTLALDAARQSRTEQIESAAESLQTARDAADKLTTESNELSKRASQAKDVRAAAEVESAETAVKFENLEINCIHDLHQPLAELLAVETLEEDFELRENKFRVEDLRDKLDGFGAVNLLALEELNQAEERLTFLTGQKKDIVDGIRAAEEALDEIKRRSRERFELAFREINRNFTEIFTELFGGGRGEMTLLDAADVLESGIEIVAQPPGKRLQNLLLLSGGEKAMTAIALVLAIFRFRPAPFCLLDEVDAPLDEANVGRFVEKIGQMSEETQFLVVTHNKRTMEAARALYGVTMEEAGVSKVVSVKFE